MRMLGPGILMLLLATILLAQGQVDAPGDIKAVLLIEGTQSVQMKESIASRKGRSGITASKQYFIFGGPQGGHTNENGDACVSVRRGPGV